MLRRVAPLRLSSASWRLLALLAIGGSLAPAARGDDVKPAERPDKPSDERREIATYHGSPRQGEPSILVQRRGDQETWTRVAPNAGVFTSDRLVSLPGYASELRTKSGAHLLLWGTLPEFNQNSPTCTYLFESAVTLHDNPKFDLEVTLERGRIYISNHKDKPALVRVRFGKEIWDLVLQERDTEVFLELFARYSDKIKYLEGEEPLSDLTMFVVKGTAALKHNEFQEIANLQGPPGPALVVWNNQEKGAKGPFKIEKNSPLLAFLGKEPANDESVKAYKEFRPALDDISKLLSEKKQVDGLLIEGVKSGKGLAQQALCVYSLGALDAGPALLDILGSEDDKTGAERETAVIALRRWICRGPQTTKVLYDAKTKEGLLVKKGYKPVEAETMIHLLYLQLSEETAKNKDTYEKLVSYLRHSKMPIRELAYYHLKQLTFGVKGMPPYDPAWNVERRNKSAAEWEALLTKGELPPKPPAPSPPKP